MDVNLIINTRAVVPEARYFFLWKKKSVEKKLKEVENERKFGTYVRMVANETKTKWKPVRGGRASGIENEKALPNGIISKFYSTQKG